MDMTTKGLSSIAIDWVSVTITMPDDDTLVLIALNDDDTWTGFRDGDRWRYADGMPIEKERVTHWAHMPPGPGAERESPTLAAPVLIPLNEHTIMILGRADFACMRVAQRLRELGHKINRNAQEEQAAVIHLNLNMYQQHGAAWFEHANAYLDQGCPASTKAEPK